MNVEPSASVMIKKPKQEMSVFIHAKIGEMMRVKYNATLRHVSTRRNYTWLYYTSGPYEIEISHNATPGRKPAFAFEYVSETVGHYFRYGTAYTLNKLMQIMCERFESDPDFQGRFLADKEVDDLTDCMETMKAR